MIDDKLTLEIQILNCAFTEWYLVKRQAFKAQILRGLALSKNTWLSKSH